MEGLGPSFADALEDYLLSLRAAGRSRLTVRHARSLLLRYGAFCEYRLAVEPSVVTRFLASLNVSHNTLAIYSGTIRLFLGHCSAQGWLPSNPASSLPRVRLRQKPVYPLTMEQVRRALSVATPRQRAIILILLSTGVRLRELADLRPGDIDVQAGTVRVRGKGGNERVLALTEALRQAMETWPGWFCYNTIKEDLASVRRAAAIPGFSAHRLRHTFAVESLKAGMRLDLLQHLMGHRSLQTTMVYLQYGTLQEEALVAQRRYAPNI